MALEVERGLCGAVSSIAFGVGEPVQAHFAGDGLELFVAEVPVGEVL
ncbi:hypothetical protein RM572_26550 [Streptomyces sp. DSM 42041]|uniref:Uncharacterized protein n=1 Tax=Streptomyces hazeniae TaxID=3075538 RepID=A0ABU2P008_9ACTN|nr:hypothetical protein [Streptomyces sp. DSM 42041]MDT0382324.1 hypothetical protein [Streptomyces sp. DSM 42041]